jgi:DNA modification methylase
MNAPADYRSFLEGKIRLATPGGFEIDPAEINPILKPHQAAIVHWAVRGGKRAIFASFGLGKSVMQLEIVRLALKQTGGRGLIVAPLGVRGEFIRDAAMLGTPVKFIRRSEEADETGIHLTNYESVRDGKLDPSLFAVASLDEASVLRGFGGTKTFREFMAKFANDARGESTASEVKYRFVATATPSPNEFIELLSYAAFLGVMDVGQAKTRWFQRNSEKNDDLTLYPHKADEFWKWIASWAVFVQRPSDLGFDDTGYVLPQMTVRWHEVPSDHSSASIDRSGQGRLLRDAAISLGDAARERRDNLPARMSKLEDLIGADPDSHRLIWHDLERERHAIEKLLPDAVTVWGSQDMEEREQAIADFSEGKIKWLATKPVLAGSGCNFQYHCHKAIFLGVGYKFNDFIQACHRVHRFLQAHPVEIDIIYSEAEREIRARLEEKWARHNEQAAIMSALIREHGLASAALADGLIRSIGCTREETSGDSWRMVRNDCVEETRLMAENSVDLIVTSIPFEGMYEYSPSYNDFGHTESSAEFWAQMDFLIPQMLRVLRPGRVCAIHVKDRITPGGINGFGFQTVTPVSDFCTANFVKHGFAFLARKTIATDVVRENNQTYRLGWSEQCKDGSRMGTGMSEYLMLYRKAPTDRSNGYADDPVTKDKPWCYDIGSDGEIVAFDRNKRPMPGTGYSRGRWQLDAHGFAISDGNRLLLPDELMNLVQIGRSNPKDKAPIYRGWKKFCAEHPYNFEQHVAFAEELDRYKLLPPDFMLIPPHSKHPDVWTDITRMRTLNGSQYIAGRELHICPLQFDIVDRAIVQLSMAGETVLDPFSGIGTVPYRAIKHKRYGIGIELNGDYCRDAIIYCREAEAQASIPSLFDLIEAEDNSKISEPSAGDIPAAGETARASASAPPPPVLLAPGDPASVEGVSASAARGHALPAVNSVSDGGLTALYLRGESEPSVTLACAPSDPRQEPVSLGLDAGATAPGREPIELPAFSDKMPNPFTGMDRSDSNPVVRQHGSTSAAVHDAGLTASPGSPASTFEDYPEIPEKLRRRRDAA